MKISRYITTQKVERPDIIVGIHPGLHAEGVYEFWEPTLELILDENIITVFTVLNEEEYSQTLGRLDHLFCKYLYKGKNPFASYRAHHRAPPRILPGAAPPTVQCGSAPQRGRRVVGRDGRPVPLDLRLRCTPAMRVRQERTTRRSHRRL